MAEGTSSPATKSRPPVKLPVWSLIHPIAQGPTKPPRLPIELIVAMPTAAAEPDRNIVGIAQSGGLAALIPTLTRLRAATTATVEDAPPASIRPTAATRQAITTCQVRSPVLSECRAHR